MTPSPTPNIIGPGKFGCRKFRLPTFIDKGTEEIKSEKEVRELIQKRIIQLEQEVRELIQKPIIQLEQKNNQQLISDTIHKLHNQDV